jgi:hypothetical protein
MIPCGMTVLRQHPYVTLPLIGTQNCCIFFEISLTQAMGVSF